MVAAGAEEQGSLGIDMVYEILSRLPVRSVLRFRCVCKPWNSLTREEYFIYSHLRQQRSKSSAGQVILHARDYDSEYRSEKRLVRWDEERFGPQGGFTFLSETWSPKLTLRSPCIRCCRNNTLPCNGLVCLYDDHAAIRLCNPATREVQILPDPTPVFKQSCSLGFVARTKEYKVVRLTHLEAVRRYEIQVLTVGRDASWRPVGYFSTWWLTERGVHVGGVIHWIVRLDPESEASIFCFDLTSEELDLVRLPDSVQHRESNERICLAPWKGKLALVEIPRRSSCEPRIINVFTRQGHHDDENNNVWDRIVFEAKRRPQAGNAEKSAVRARCGCGWDICGGLSSVGHEGILVWRRWDLQVYFCRDFSWSQFYRPIQLFDAFPSHEVRGFYAFEESLVPLQKSATLQESEFPLDDDESPHAIIRRHATTVRRRRVRLANSRGILTEEEEEID